VRSFGRYTSNARELDAFVWRNRDAVVVFAAGNEGTDANANGVVDAGSIGSPGTAKNCITVGASENRRPDFRYRSSSGLQFGTYGELWPEDYPVPPLANDRLANNEDGLAPFSSRGPTRDGRIKPDLVAPGTAILSARSRAAGVGTGWSPSSDPLYMFEGGTSMATPLVSGCAAVVRQYLKDKRDLPRPSAALVKALLINGARDLRGQHVPTETGAIPNIAEGFGRVDLASSVGAKPQLIHELWDEGPALETGERQVFSVTLPEKVSFIRVTLVWTDPPGEALQNDLDLVVKTFKGTVRHGNMGQNTKGFDRLNNVEQVTMTNVLPGKLDVTVKAFRVTGAPQTFALVVRALA
jgi:hypothetical protein